jgi:aerobic-type carbon monoxide dehydrogenase small subunit (CoxS/CutS family)
VLRRATPGLSQLRYHRGILAEPAQLSGQEVRNVKRQVKFNVNGKPVSLNTEDDRTLIWVLRNDLELTGTKFGCGDGICGSCTVVVNGEAIRSCQTSLSQVQGKKVVTVEGLERDGKLHPLQQAFIDHGALQCGFCTSGMLMNAYVMLEKHKKPSRSKIVEEMDDHLCRCGAHQRIVAAIEDAATRTGGGR